MADIEAQTLHRINSMGESTRFEYEKIIYGAVTDFDFDFTIADLKQELDLEEKLVFRKGVVEQLEALGVHCAIDNEKLIIDEITKRYENRLGTPCPKSVKNWIRNQKTSTAESNRTNMYNFCYALEMDIEKTADFFMRYFRTDPFNYKDARDAVYFYCFYNNRDYSSIKRLLDMVKVQKAVQGLPKQSTKEAAFMPTIEVRNSICTINIDDDLVQYLLEHCCTQEQQYQRARNEIKGLIDFHLAHRFKDGEVIPLRERRNEKDKKNMSDIRTIDGKFDEKTEKIYYGLYYYIMGFEYQINEKILNKSDCLPKDFTRSLPTNQDFSKIMNDESVSYEVLRKTLVILLFYDSYVRQHSTGEELGADKIKERLNDFYTETNKKLTNCGLVPLYMKNLFDKVILFCASTKSPLDTFYGINDLRFLEPQD